MGKPIVAMKQLFLIASCVLAMMLSASCADGSHDSAEQQRKQTISDTHAQTRTPFALIRHLIIPDFPQKVKCSAGHSAFRTAEPEKSAGK